MDLLPAIDLLKGRVVSLVGGVRGTQTVELPDPWTTYERWIEEGAEWIHLVDLDAAFEDGDHRLVVQRILEDGRARIQVGGGIRTSDQIRRLVEAGAERVVVGTQGLQDPAWLDDVAREFDGRIVLAVDAKNGRVVSRAWRESTGRDVVEVVERMSRLPLAALLYTSVDVEGKMQGIDRTGIRKVCAASELPVIASGGITNYGDLKFLMGLGVEAAVLGAALYQGKIQFPQAKNLVEGV